MDVASIEATAKRISSARKSADIRFTAFYRIVNVELINKHGILKSFMFMPSHDLYNEIVDF